MHDNPVLRRHPGLRALLVAAVLSVWCFAWAQEADEVHIAPKEAPSQTSGLILDSSQAGGSQVYAHIKPFQAAIDVVLVPVTVTDSLSQPVTSLKKQDFVLLDDDTPQEIQYFWVEQAPMSIALLLDVSGSMSEKIERERDAVTEFFNNANPEDEYFAISFSERPHLLADATQSRDEMERKLLSAERGGATALMDAIYLAEYKLRKARYSRRAILIISDGGDNASRYTRSEIRRLTQESDVQIYAVGLFDKVFFRTLEEKLGRKWLTEITDSTGGRTIPVDNPVRMPEAAAQISWELRHQYVLGYRSPKAGPPGWHKIKVRVTPSQPEKPLRAYYRKGYIAPDK